MRADARRNRERIITAARELVASKGPDAGMEEIAARAEVAVGTLYRHFPAKEDLVAAVITDLVADIADRAARAHARAREGASPVAELTAFLTDIVHNTAALFALKPHAPGPTDPAGAEQAARADVTALLDRARAAGEVRAGITIDDIDLVLGTAPSHLPPEQRARWLDLVLRGLLSALP